MPESKIVWSDKALSDLKRLHAFLLENSAEAAIRWSEAVALSTERLKTFPRIGEAVSNFTEAEVRRIHVAQYEIRYSLMLHEQNLEVVILRIWHTREYRPQT
jgi:plasmid stabilization system protein ParE